MKNEDLGRDIESFCEKYSIPTKYFLKIINDQKVVPMLRGKGMEYTVFDLLKKFIGEDSWQINKMNLNPQTGFVDEDISITHLRTGVRLVAESKMAVRGSFSLGLRSKLTPEPHLRIKCHKSRSFIGRVGNDRYSVGEFDIVISNPSNSLFKIGSLGDELELIDDQNSLNFLKDFYKVDNGIDLLKKATNDWRFVVARDIATDGLIPRTPIVLLKGDLNWKPLSDLPSVLLDLVKAKIAVQKQSHNLR